MSDTPRTDAVWADKKQNILEHARQLERELNEAKQRGDIFEAACAKALNDRDALKQCAEELAEWLKWYHDADKIPCVNSDCEIKLALGTFNQLKNNE